MVNHVQIISIRFAQERVLFSQAVFNFSDKIQEVCPGENPEILFYSAATQWKGTEEMEKAFYVNRMLPPASVVLLQKETGKND